ncbi:hypothetical protein KOW79_014550 [Hemibagrus wyckioides]|uniref:THD domain-containing protein n=1 Tax=Hemibagrus wyckioides TaxID=337641 RepID=A0A9D3NJ01_9TELE|nr:hypothetical protein KOW79_014550 [Hemibagrus wyckioides]
MVAVITKGNNQRTEKIKADAHEGPDQSSVNYIHLVWGNETSPWRHSSLCFCPNTTLLLQNDLVEITTGGFYQTYAQVTFIDKEKEEGTVTLVANENVPGKAARKLSEAEHRGGTVSMSAVIRLKNGDRVKLHIKPPSLILRDPSKTYWGLYMLDKQKDK